MKIKVAVVFGGRSTEHEISIISAVQAMHAIDRDRYDVVPVYMSKEGDFFTGDALTDVITVRAYAKGDITVTPYADVYTQPP